MSIFEYAFMQRAFIVGILLGMTIPCIGTIIVLKRLSMLGDTLSHTSLAGVAGGLVFHINPVVGATVTCIGAALGIEAIRKRYPSMQKLQLQSCSLLVSVLQLYYRVLSVMLLILTVFFLAVLLPLVIPNYIWSLL